MSENTPPDAAEPDEAALAGQERLSEQVVRTGMFGTQTTGDTSGYGGLQVRRAPAALHAPRPYGSYFDEVADALATRLEADGGGFGEAVERVIVDRGELTLHVRAGAPDRGGPAAARRAVARLRAVRWRVRGALPRPTSGRELHAVYHLLSITHNRRLRLEVSVPDADPHVPSLVGVYPTCNWHERETWDFFGIVFDGHPGADQDRDAGRLEGPPAAEGLPAGRDPGRVPRRHRAAAGRAEVVHVTTQAGGTGGPAADGTEGTEGRVYNVGGGDWDEVVQAAAGRRATRRTPSTSSSTWARSTRLRTACCGWC